MGELGSNAAEIVPNAAQDRFDFGRGFFRKGGAGPLAIWARLSRMWRMEARTEPMMRYCCWKSCIRLMVVDGPEVEPQVTNRPPRLRQRSEPLKVSAPTCSNTTSTPFLAVILRTAPSKRSVR